MLKRHHCYFWPDATNALGIYKRAYSDGYRFVVFDVESLFTNVHGENDQCQLEKVAHRE